VNSAECRSGAALTTKNPLTICVTGSRCSYIARCSSVSGTLYAPWHLQLQGEHQASRIKHRCETGGSIPCPQQVVVRQNSNADPAHGSCRGSESPHAPVWRVLEPRRVQEEHNIPLRVVRADGAEVSVTCTTVRTMRRQTDAKSSKCAGRCNPGTVPLPGPAFMGRFLCSCLSVRRLCASRRPRRGAPCRGSSR
jgi:hypothetical protein